MKRLFLTSIVVALITSNSVDPKFAKNLTLYHVNEANYSGIANMDTGDAAGDAFFSLRSVYLPIECASSAGHRYSGDCDNPEIVGDKLTITEVVVQVDSRFGNYSECNVCVNSTVPFTHDVPCTDGDYVCVCGDFRNLTTHCPPTVGIEQPSSVFNRFKPNIFSPNYEWWLVNLVRRLTGYWYSTPASGQCKSSDPASTPCFWEVMATKRKVSKNCQQKYIFSKVTAANQQCFNSCDQPSNTTSTCFIECFYTTILGEHSNHKYSTGGMTQEQIVDLWTFAIANDETKGGCPDYKPS